jgi:hypothetical protein
MLKSMFKSMNPSIFLFLSVSLLFACASQDNKPQTPAANVPAAAPIVPTQIGAYTLIGDSLLLPPVEIEVSLSEKATQKFGNITETIIVDASFSAPSSDPNGKNYEEPTVVATVQKELNGNERRARFEGIKFPKRLYDSLFDKDVELLVNVYSGRKSSPDNLLSCGIVSEKASVFKDKKYTIKCKLIYGE